MRMSEPDSNIREDTDLMTAAAGGDLAAFETLIRRHQNGLVNFFTRLGASSHAEDLAQETFIRLFKYRRRYTASARFTTFLYTLARHAWYDTLRKWRRRDAGLARYQTESEALGDERLEPRERRAAAVRAAVERLPEKLRLVVTLSVYEGFDYAAIGKIAGIPEGTVKSRMFLATRRLKEWLKDDDSLQS